MMAGLITEPNIPDPDVFYETLVGAHRDLSETESAALNSRLLLLLANHIGDRSVLAEALAAAVKAGAPRADGAPTAR